jgi:hypothetical protein
MLAFLNFTLISISAVSQAPGATSSSIMKSSIGQHHMPMYTPLSELTKEEVDAFKAKSFVLGKIPTRPPPRELIQVANT